MHGAAVVSQFAGEGGGRVCLKLDVQGHRCKKVLDLDGQGGMGGLEN